MAKIKSGDKELEIEKSPKDTFEKLGVNFSCESGTCGICRCKIKKGMENINPKTEAEHDFPLDDDERLACQIKEVAGDIEIEYEEW